MCDASRNQRDAHTENYLSIRLEILGTPSVIPKTHKATKLFLDNCGER